MVLLMAHEQLGPDPVRLPTRFGLTELCQTLMPVLETRQSSCDTFLLLEPEDNSDIWLSPTNVSFTSVAPKDRPRYVCRHLSTEELTKASNFGVQLDVDANSLFKCLQRILSTRKPPVDAN
ncbi:unnamed protein product [Dibothriocephalus latus]|uniref:Uncharacterized protein n=1 Tax=Dibothriocephalus latus TaxID=60516 RepID=A0A3P7RD62_DIBLA|nr:unnamed protein product [Dibothriocephalus latus]